MEKYTVKARARQGTKSMDLTIPSKINEELEISAGDIFEISVENEKTVKLIYKRVYKV